MCKTYLKINSMTEIMKCFELRLITDLEDKIFSKIGKNNTLEKEKYLWNFFLWKCSYKKI